MIGWPLHLVKFDEGVEIHEFRLVVKDDFRAAMHAGPQAGFALAAGDEIATRHNQEKQSVGREKKVVG